MPGNSGTLPGASSMSQSGCRPQRGWIKTDGAGRPARSRLGIIFGGLLLLFCALSVRMAQIQVIQGPRLKKQAERQQVACEKLPAPRGSISDATTLPLVFN